MPYRVYVEAEVSSGADVDSLCREIAQQHGAEAIRNTVLLVWFDAEERPTPSELARHDYWDVT
jgi:hypothetical protein